MNHFGYLQSHSALIFNGQIAKKLDIYRVNYKDLNAEYVKLKTPESSLELARVEDFIDALLKKQLILQIVHSRYNPDSHDI